MAIPACTLNGSYSSSEIHMEWNIADFLFVAAVSDNLKISFIFIIFLHSCTMWLQLKCYSRLITVRLQFVMRHICWQYKCPLSDQTSRDKQESSQSCLEILALGF